jgi:hypothetical protein
MLGSYATGLLGIAVVLVLWVWVQTAWRRTFPGVLRDPDVLAERTGCGRCETGICLVVQRDPDRTDGCERLAGAGASTEEECT